MHDNWVREDLQLALIMTENVTQLTHVVAFVNDIFK